MTTYRTLYEIDREGLENNPELSSMLGHSGESDLVAGRMERYIATVYVTIDGHKVSATCDGKEVPADVLDSFRQFAADYDYDNKHIATLSQWKVVE